MTMRRTQPLRALGVGLFSLTALLAPAAGAQTAEEKATADALFDAARTEMEQKNYESACQKLRDSQKLDPAVGTLLNLANCYELSGKTSSAYSTYREAAAMARTQGQGEREEFARGEVARLKKLLTQLVLEVRPEALAIEGLSLTSNGVVIPRTLWGSPVPIDPGTCVVTASAPGYRTIEVSVEAIGRGEAVRVSLPPLEKVPGAAGAPAPASAGEASSAPTTESSRAGPGPWPWVLGGAGLAAVGVGTALAIVGNQANKDAEQICPDLTQSCSVSDLADWRDETSRASAMYTGAYISWAVGGAALVGATVWLLTSGKGSQTTGALSVTPSIGFGSLGLSARGVF